MKMLRQGFTPLLLGLTAVACSPEQPATISGPNVMPSFVLGASAGNALTSGTVGVNSDPAATSGRFYLRHVGGDPNTTGLLGTNYSHVYQWATPRISVPSPETGPVVMQGAVNVSAQPVGSVAFIGLIDALALAQGGTIKTDGTYNRFAGYQSGAYVYIFRRADGWVIAPTDGNQGGDIAQRTTLITNANMPANGVLNIRLTVDGTVDAATCAIGANAGQGPQLGCVTVTVSGQAGGPTTVSDSYGAIKINTALYPTQLYSHDEFQQGAVFGWDDFGTTNVSYAFVVEADGTAPTVSNVALSLNPAFVGEAVTLSAKVAAVGNGESVKTVEYRMGTTGAWTAMTAGAGGTWTASIAATEDATFCVRATDGLATTDLSDDTSDGAACADLDVQTPVSYAISGFFSPVSMGGVVNTAKAGRTIPLKFRVLDETGAPYAGLGLSDVAVRSAQATGPESAETLAGGSGLQYLGDGNYQFNWATPNAYANQTRTLTLSITKRGIASTPISALFRFTR